MITDPTTKITRADGSTFRMACPEAVTDLYRTGCAIPDIQNITFNLGKKAYPKLNENGKPMKDEDGNVILKDEEVPVLTTVICFADGTKEVVTSSEGDGVQLDDNGRPTVFSKECGIAFCVLKRILAGRYTGTDYDLNYKSAGFGRILNDLIKMSVDQNELKEKKKEEKAAKANKSDKPITVKAKSPSLHNCVVDLSQNISDLKDIILTIKSDLNK